MSVIDPVIGSIDNENKLIFLANDIREYHPVDDIYKEVRNLRRLNENFRKFDIPVKAEGAVPKGGGKYTPRYAIFQNGWKIVPEDISHGLYISGEQITDDGQSGPACINTDILSDGVSVIIQYQPPAAEIVRDEVSLNAIAYMSFGDPAAITVDPINGKSLASGGIGNAQSPLDDNIEAWNTAEKKDITKIHFRHNNIISTPLNLRGYILEGDSPVTTTLHLNDAAVVLDCEIRDLTVSGVLDGGTLVVGCDVNGIQYFNGAIKNCGITAEPIVLGGSNPANIINCYSVVPGGNARPRIDFDNEPTSLAIRNWQGGLELVNKTNPSGDISIDMSSGVLYVRSSCTAGSLTVRGLGRLVDESGDGCQVNYDGLLDPAYVQFMTYNGVVSIDAVNGVSGTVYPIGSANEPVNNLADAVTIAENLGLSELNFLSDFYFPDGTYISNYKLVGQGSQKTVLTFESGSVLAYCEAFNAQVTGRETGIVGFTNCLINELGSVGLTPSSTNIIATNCLFKGTTKLPSNYSGTITAINCLSTPSVSGAPIFDMGESGAHIQVRNWSGSLKISNITNQVSVQVFLATGSVTLDSSVIAGDFLISGVGTLENNATSVTTINADGLMSKDTVSLAVWDEPISKHLLPGSTGLSIGNQQFDGYIWISESGSVGTEFPVGTRDNPVNNLTDAFTIAKDNGIVNFYFLTDFTILSTDVVSGIIFTGGGSSATKLTFESGCITANCQAIDCMVTGMSLGLVLMENCRVSNYGGSGALASDKTILLKNSAIEGELSIPWNYTGILRVVNCYSIHSLPLGPPSVSYNGGAFTTLVESFSGELSVTNCTNGGATTSVDLISGVLTLSETVLSGDFNVRGVGILNDNSTGIANINSSGLINKDVVSQSVWEHSIANKLSDDINFIKDVTGGKWEIINNQMIFYKDDNVTEVARLNLFNSAGTPTMENVMSRERV